MALREERNGESGTRPTPKAQTAWLGTHMAEWPEFVAAIQASHADWAAHEAARAVGLPPGWVTSDDYRRCRALRRGL